MTRRVPVQVVEAGPFDGSTWAVTIWGSPAELEGLVVEGGAVLEFEPALGVGAPPAAGALGGVHGAAAGFPPRWIEVSVACDCGAAVSVYSATQPPPEDEADRVWVAAGDVWRCELGHAGWITVTGHGAASLGPPWTQAGSDACTTQDQAECSWSADLPELPGQRRRFEFLAPLAPPGRGRDPPLALSVVHLDPGVSVTRGQTIALCYDAAESLPRGVQEHVAAWLVRLFFADLHGVC